MRTMTEQTTDSHRISNISPKLWIYTNFDCNLKCSYCVAESTPTADRRALSVEDVQQIIDEAVALGFEKVFFTGGEPFILNEIYAMLDYAAQRMPTTVLTNAMLCKGKRLERLKEIANPKLSVQVSLDGGSSEAHDPYRGDGTWQKTVDGIHALLSNDFQVSISTTETKANSDRLDELHAFRRDLGIADDDHFVRPMAKRGFADEGVAVSVNTLVPEMTITAYGVYWHPLVSPSDSDMRVSEEVFPLAAAVQCIEQRMRDVEVGQADERAEFT